MSEWLNEILDLVDESERRGRDFVSDLISRTDVLHELDGCDYELKDWQRWKLKTMVRDIPSAEPKTPQNGSITCVKPEKMHDRTMSDTISRQDAIDAVCKELCSGYDCDVVEMYDDIFMCKSCSEGDRCQDGVKCVARWNYEQRIQKMRMQIAMESRKLKERRCRNGDQRKDYRNDR